MIVWDDPSVSNFGLAIRTAAPSPNFSGSAFVARIFEESGGFPAAAGLGRSGSLSQALESGSARNLSEAFQQLNPSEQNALRERWGRSLDELLSLSNERDATIFHQGLLELGHRLEDADQLELASAVYSALVAGNAPRPPLTLRGGEVGGVINESGNHVPPLRVRGGQEELLPAFTRAQSRLNAIHGVGDWRRRLAFNLERLPANATRWDMLFAMGGAGLAFRSLRLAATARWASSFESAFALNAAATSTAFVGESLAFTSLGRLFGTIAGHRYDWSAEGTFNEWAGGAAMLLGLKAMGGVFGNLSERWAAGETAFARITRAVAPQAGMFSGIVLGNRLAELGGFHPERRGDTWLVDGLTTLFEFNIAGRVQRSAAGSGLRNLEGRMEAYTRTLHAGEFSLVSRFAVSRSKDRLLREGWGEIFSPSLVTPEGIRMSAEDPLSLSTVFSMSHEGLPASGANSSKAPNGGSRPLATPEHRTLRAFVEQIIRRIYPDYFENLHRLPSEVSPASPEQQSVIERELELLLREGELERLFPRDPIVEVFSQKLYRRPANSNGGASPILGRLYREIEQAQEGLASLRFSDGTLYQPSRLRRSPSLSRLLQRPFYFFDDTQRVTGSFKERGAFVEALRARQEGALHLVTASHGNHGLAVAMAAQQLGLRSTVVVPHTTPQIKISALENFGATVVTTHAQPWRGYEESRDWGLRYTLERNYLLEQSSEIRGSVRYIHGFEDVLAGQGVAGLEIADQILQLPANYPRRFSSAAFLIPMGGGGLAAGVATVLKHRFPESHVFGVVSNQALALHHSLLEGHRVEVYVNERGLCDSGIGLSVPGRKPFEVLREVLDGSMAVSDPFVGEAMRLIHRHEGLVVEGAAATGLAALLDPRFAGFGLDPHTPIVALFTGRNIDLSRHRAVMTGEEAPLSGGILDLDKPSY